MKSPTYDLLKVDLLIIKVPGHIRQIPRPTEIITKLSLNKTVEKIWHNIVTVTRNITFALPCSVEIECEGSFISQWDR